MFKEKTVFILGAGSSKAYGYPLGKELINSIIENISRDEVLLPGISEKENYSFKELEPRFFKRNPDDFNGLVKSPTGHELYILNEQDYFHAVKLERIDIFSHLKKTLVDFDPVSIDSFLRDHPSCIKAGKIMIFYSLLKFEKEEKFKHQGNPPADGNWYSCLLNDILSGAEKPEDVLKNKLDIITFNYSIDLDYCLYKKIGETEFLSSISEKVIDSLKNHVHHVYGQLQEKDIVATYGQYSNEKVNSNSKRKFEVNSQRFVYSICSKDQIKLINSERNSNESKKYKKLIKSAKNIVIIGFAFDRDNLDIIGFPRTQNEYLEYFKGKTVKWMNYNDSMKGLYNQFSILAKESKEFNFIHTSSCSIVEAYQNDFKLFLYEQ